jgi:hypothetical protein
MRMKHYGVLDDSDYEVVWDRSHRGTNADLLVTVDAPLAPWVGGHRAA